MDNELVEIGIWIKVFLVCFVGLGAAIGFFIFFSGNAFFTKASGGDARMQFTPATITAKKGDTFTVQVMIDTNKSPVKGVDFVALFDPTKLALRMVMPTAQKDTELKTFLPIDESLGFNFTKVISRANNEGRIEFGAIAADVQKNTLRKPVNGTFILASLEFYILKEGNTAVSIIKKHQTPDSTVVQDINPPVNILSQTNTLYISPPVQQN